MTVIPTIIATLPDYLSNGHRETCHNLSPHVRSARLGSPYRYRIPVLQNRPLPSICPSDAIDLRNAIQQNPKPYPYRSGSGTFTQKRSVPCR